MYFVETLDPRRLFSVTVESAAMNLVNLDGSPMQLTQPGSEDPIPTQWRHRVTATVANPDGDLAANVKLQYVDPTGAPLVTVLENSYSVGAPVDGKSVLTFDYTTSYGEIQFPKDRGGIALLQLIVDDSSTILDGISGGQLPTITTQGDKTIYTFADGTTTTYDPNLGDGGTYTTQLPEPTGTPTDDTVTESPSTAPLKASKPKKLKVFLSEDAELSKDDVVAGKYTGSIDDVKTPKKLGEGEYHYIVAASKKSADSAQVLDDTLIVESKPNASASASKAFSASAVTEKDSATDDLFN